MTFFHITNSVKQAPAPEIHWGLNKMTCFIVSLRRTVKGREKNGLNEGFLLLISDVMFLVGFFEVHTTTTNLMLLRSP